MAETTGIQWTDATVNFWWGCTKVSPGCDHCYAETWSKRTGEAIWGVGAPRRKIKSALKSLYRLQNNHAWWAADHQIGQYHDHSPQRVFLQSMSDLFDAEVPVEWFAEAWGAICSCRNLELQLVTKRLPNVEKRLNQIGGTWPSHACLIISVVNQDEADRDIPRLIALKAKLGIPWVGLSMEPLLGPVDLTDLSIRVRPGEQPCGLAGLDALTGIHWDAEDTISGIYGSPDPHIDWVIVGGESGPGARPMHPDWVRSLRDQCAAADVPFFFKQWGEWAQVFDRDQEDPDWRNCSRWDREHPKGRWHNLAGGTGFHGERVIYVDRVGKKAAGRLLDGVEHNAFPEVRP